jgi:hypothetical protein
MEKTLKTLLRWSVFVIAVAVTTGWLILCASYLTRMGWDGLLSLEPGDLAALLAAAAGPPVALWLILVVVAQQQDLTILRRAVLDMGFAMRRSQEQVESQSRALLEASAASRRQAAQDLLPVVLDDLAGSAAVVAERLGVLTRDDVDLAWARHGAGDRSALLRPFVARAHSEDDFAVRLNEALAGDLQSKLAAEAFVNRVDGLRSEGQDAFPLKLVSDLFEDGPVSQVYALFSGAGSTRQPVVSDNADGIESANAAEADEEDDMNDRLGPQPTLFPAASAGS